MLVNRLIRFFIIGVFICFLGCIVYLGFHNVPSVVDGFCFSSTVIDYGFWKAQSMYYNGWTGRYFSNFYFHINPLVWGDSQIPFIIIPVVLFISLFVAIITFFQQLFLEDCKKPYGLLFSIGFGVIYILNLSKISEAFFWYTGSYTIVSILLLLIVLSLWKSYDAINNLQKGLLLFVYFLTLGSSEVTMLCLSFLAFIYFTSYYLKNKQLSRFEWLMIAITLLGNAIVIFAPGNSVRHSGEIDLFPALQNTMQVSSMQILQWSASPTLLIGSIAFILFSIIRKPFNIKTLPLWQSLTLTVCIMFIAFFPPVYGLGPGQNTPPRILNLIYFFFLLSWVYNIYLISLKMPEFNLDSVLLSSSLVLVILFIGALYSSNNIKFIYRDIRYSLASSYHEEYLERVSLLQSGESVLHLKEFERKPYNIFISDIEEDPAHLWNRCLSNYYNKTEIILVKNED
jgi:hypothetical protein